MAAARGSRNVPTSGVYSGIMYKVVYTMQTTPKGGGTADTCSMEAHVARTRITGNDGYADLAETRG